MNDFERALGRELGRLEAPQGFSDRVMERLAWREREARRKQEARRPTQCWRLAIAAGLLVVAGAGSLSAAHEYRERREAEEARRQFDVAMRVANRSLEAVHRGLDRAEKPGSATKEEMR